MLQIIGNIMLVIAFCCSLMLTADAFKKAKWKGWLCILIFPIYFLGFLPPEWLLLPVWIAVLICPLYSLYYGAKEFENEDKTVFLWIWLVCLGLGFALFVNGIPDIVNHHSH